MSSIFKNIENYTSLLTIGNKKDNIDDYVLEDFYVEDYQHHQQIKMAMIA